MTAKQATETIAGPSWKVLWADFRGHHDWIGPGSVKRGLRKNRKKPPARQIKEFHTIEGAREFVSRLQADIPEDELAVSVVPIIERDPPPEQQSFATGWRLQRRGER